MKKASINLSSKTVELLAKYDEQLKKESQEAQAFLEKKNMIIQSFQEQKKSLLRGIILQSDFPENINWKLEGNELVEQTLEEVEVLAKDPNNILHEIDNEDNVRKMVPNGKNHFVNELETV